MIEFKIHDHYVRGPGVKLVQVLVNGQNVATITPDDTGRGIRVISTHVDKIVATERMHDADFDIFNIVFKKS